MNCSPSGQAVLFSVGGSPAPIAEVKELRPIRAKVEGAINWRLSARQSNSSYSASVCRRSARSVSSTKCRIAFGVALVPKVSKKMSRARAGEVGASNCHEAAP